MKKVILMTVLVAVVALFAGCGGKPPLTPQETFDAYKSAWQTKDFDKAWELIGEPYRRDYEERLTVLQKSMEMGMRVQNPFPITRNEVKAMKSGKDLYIALGKLTTKKAKEGEEVEQKYMFMAKDYTDLMHFNNEKVIDEILAKRATLYYKDKTGNILSIILFLEDDNVWRIHKMPD